MPVSPIARRCFSIAPTRSSPTGALRADVEHLKGEIQLRCGVLLDACDILMAGATDIAPVDTRKALQMLLQAREAAGWAGDTPRTIDTGHRAAALPRGDDPASRFLADLLVGVGSLYEGKTAIGMPLVLDVVARIDEFDEPGWVVWAATGAQAVGDEARAAELLQRAIALARASGAVDELTYVLLAYVLMGLLAGRFGVAAEAAEGLTLAREVGLPNAASTHLAMLAWFAAQQGEEGECRGSAATAIELARPSGGAFANSIAEWGVGLLELSRRRADEAVARLIAVGESRPGEGHPYFALMSAPDLVEACMLAGRDQEAQSGLGGVRGLRAARRADLGARAVCTLPGAAFRGADGRLRGGARAARGERPPYDRARTELLFGECLARRRQHVESREHLRAALEEFERLGAERMGRSRSCGAPGERRGSRTRRLEPPVAAYAAGVADRPARRRRPLQPGGRRATVPLAKDNRRAAAQHLRHVGISSRVELAQFELAPEISRDVLRSRLARAGLAELFRELRTLRGAALQDALARTLGDPALVVAHRLPDAHAYVDGDGDRGDPADRRRGPRGRDRRARRSRGRRADLRRGARRGSRAGRGRLRRGHHRAGERAPSPRVAGTPCGAAGIAAANRRGGRRRAAATRAQPARRRTAAAGGPRAPATTDADRHPPRPLHRRMR